MVGELLEASIYIQLEILKGIWVTQCDLQVRKTVEKLKQIISGRESCMQWKQVMFISSEMKLD